MRKRVTVLLLLETIPQRGPGIQGDTLNHDHLWEDLSALTTDLVQ